MSALALIVESAALYTSWALFFFFAYQTRSNLAFFAIDCLPTISGIAFLLIHVRVSLGWAQKASSPSISVSSGASSTQAKGRVQSELYATRPLAVNIQSVTDINTDSVSFGRNSNV